MNIIILGGGAAGITAAEQLRKKDKDSGILLITGEECLPYYRPRLIDVLAGKASLEEIYIKKPEWYAGNGIELIKGKTVTRIDTAAGRVYYNGGEAAYDKLLLAMGSRPFKPPVEGLEGDCVYVLRTAKDVEAILECAKTKKRAVVIGGGLLGIEAANALCSIGAKATVIECYDCLMPRQVDREGAGFLKEILEGKGIVFKMKSDVTSVIMKDAALEVNMKEGSISSDFVIVASGVRSRLELAGSAGIKTGRGIMVDNSLQTNIENIYAAGDVCEHNGRVYGVWQAAREQALVAAENMAGGKASYEGSVISSRLKVTGIELVSIGNISGEGCSQYSVMDREKGVYRKLLVKDGKVAGTVLFGDTGGSSYIQKLIKDETEISGREQDIIEGKQP